ETLERGGPSCRGGEVGALQRGGDLGRIARADAGAALRGGRRIRDAADGEVLVDRAERAGDPLRRARDPLRGGLRGAGELQERADELVLGELPERLDRQRARIRRLVQLTNRGRESLHAVS